MKKLLLYIGSGILVAITFYISAINEKNVWGIDKKECFTDALMIGATWIIAVPLFVLLSLISFLFTVFEKVFIDL